MSYSTSISDSSEILKSCQVVDEVSNESEFELNDPSLVWYVDSGLVNVFAVEVANDCAVSAYRNIHQAEEGSFIFGTEIESDLPLQLRARGSQNFRVLTFRLEELLELEDGEFMASHIDTWIVSLSESVTKEIEIQPPSTLKLAQRECVDVVPSDIVTSRKGVVWLSASKIISYLGSIDLDNASHSWIALTNLSWVVVREPTSLQCRSSQEIISQGKIQHCLKEFHRYVLRAEEENHTFAMVDAALLQTDRTRLRQSDEAIAREELQTLKERAHSPDDRKSEIYESLQLIGKREGLRFFEPDFKKSHMGEDISIDQILIASGIRSRKVSLDETPRWWHGDNGALLGYLKDGHMPIALLPTWFDRYSMQSRNGGPSVRINHVRAGELENEAWTFYEPLPKGPASKRDLTRILTRNLGGELARYVFASLCSALLAFVPAVLLGVLVDEILPLQSKGLLWTLVLVLVFVTIAGVLTHLVQSFALVRAEGRALTRITAALWDRVLDLRSSDLRDYTAGDLSSRIMAFSQLRESISSALANTFSSFVFILPAMGLLFIYDEVLAVFMIGLGVLTLIPLICIGTNQSKLQDRYLNAKRALLGNLTQFINGIARIQKSGAIQSIFAFWARGYRKQKNAEIAISRHSEVGLALTAALPAIAAGILFAIAMWFPNEDVTSGAFLTIYIATMMFFCNISKLGAAISAFASVFPSFKQIRPLLELPTDYADQSRKSTSIIASDVRGDLRLDHVSFSYDVEEPMVLEDISFHIRAGEFVAIVGESGSGKSTLFSLLLGIDKPTSGTVFFDDQNIAHIHPQSLRQQIGIVLQETALQPTNILQNILGLHANLSEEDAWRAAKAAAVASDIQEMPMQMHTSVHEDVRMFSGGQTQRIQIAAAIVNNPRVVFLDEATNWLDNRNQAQIMNSIEQISATRLVIAHRLSTVRHADRIFVLDSGKLVQEGTYDELLEVPGKFRDLTHRQQI